MKIVLINTPSISQEYIKFEKKWEFIEDEYLGFGILEAIINKFNHELYVLDDQSIDILVERCISLNPDIIGISIMQMSSSNALNLILKLRTNGFENCILVGGWFVRNTWVTLFEEKWPIDGACFTDAESVLPTWLQYYEKGIKKSIPGIATYSDYIQQKEIMQVDQNDWINHDFGYNRKNGRNVYRIEASRGCPSSNCAFCSLSVCNIVSRCKWTPISWEKVIFEIETLYNRYGVNKFSFTDDDLLGPVTNSKNRAKRLRDELRKKQLNIEFSASISVLSVDEDTINYLRDAGLYQLGIGFESADEEQLKRYRKPQKLADNYKAADILIENGIKLIPGLITFDPFATPDTISKNISFLFDYLKHYELGKLTKKLHLVTGTSIINDIKNANLLKGNYLQYDYSFLYKETAKLYDEFSEYTKFISNYQEKGINNGHLSFLSELENLHKKIAKLILNNQDWLNQAKEKVQELERNFLEH